MAQNVVVKDVLSDNLIQAGKWLTEQLLASHLAVSGSFWLYREETNSWRLMITSPEVKRIGQIAIYDKIRSLLAQAADVQDLSLFDIGVVSEKDPVYQALRCAVRTGDAIASVRFSQNVINGHYIDDVYIYRMT